MSVVESRTSVPSFRNPVQRSFGLRLIVVRPSERKLVTCLSSGEFRGRKAPKSTCQQAPPRSFDSAV